MLATLSKLLTTLDTDGALNRLLIIIVAAPVNLSRAGGTTPS
jgi:hypothetical protein